MYTDSAANSSLLLIWQSAILPGLLAAAAAGLWAWLRARGRSQLAGHVAPLLLALAFWLCGGLIRNRWGLPPAQAMDRLLLVPLLWWLWDLVADRLPPRVRRAEILLAAGAVLWIFWPLLRHGAGVYEAVVLAGLWLLPRLADRVLTVVPPVNGRALWWVLVPATLAPLVAIDGSLLSAQLSGLLAALAGLCWLTAALRKDEGLATLTADFGRRAAPLLLGVAALYADAHLPALLLAPGLTLAGLLVARRTEGGRPALVQLALAGAGLALALWLVWPEESLY